MSIREEQCRKVCRILDDVLANRPTERDSLIVATRNAFSALSAPCEDAVSRTAVQYLLAHFVDEDKYVDACDGLKHLPPVTPKQSLDIEKVSKEVLNATSKWLNDKDDKRNVLDVIKDVLQPYKGKE